MRWLTGLSLAASLPNIAQADLNVVADIAPVYSIVATIMDGAGTPELLVPAKVDAHDFALRPSDGQKLSQSDLFVGVGPVLIPWIDDVVELAPAGSVTLFLSQTDGWTALPMRSAHHGDHEGGDAHDDHDDHDDHEHAGTVDPHGWLSPTVGMIWADAIADTLIAVDPQNANIYRSNHDQMKRDLSEVKAEFDAALSGIQPFLWPHDGYQYLEVEYDLPAIGALSSAHGETPGPASLQELLDDAGGAACLFTDLTTSDREVALLNDVAELKVMPLFDLDQSVDATPDYYVQHLRQIGAQLSKCR